MSQYTNSIEEMLDSLIETIDQYSNFDNNAIINKKTIDNIKKEIQSLNTKSIKLIDEISKYNNIYQKNILSNYDKYNNLNEEKNKIYNNEENEYNKLILSLDNTLNKKIDEINERLENKKNKFKDDIEENTKISNENIKYFNDDYKSTEKRLAFKNQSSKDSYHNNIAKYNDLLEIEIKKLDKAYQRLYINYDADTKSLINKYNKQIEDLKNQYKKVQKDKEDYINQCRKVNKEDAIILNDEIRPFYDEKNKNIEIERQIYLEKQNKSNEEKEIKKQGYHNETNKITKEFIVKAKQIDDTIDNYEKEYVNNRDKKINQTLYIILDEHKKIENEVKVLFKQIDDINEKRIKKLIKIKYRLYAKKKHKIEEKLDSELRDLESIYLKRVQEKTFERKKLEYEKNCTIKKYIEIENTLNKEYQELNNKYEFELRQSEEVHKFKYDTLSSEKKLSYSLEQIKKNRNKDEELIRYDVKLEEITYKLKNTKENLDVVKKLNNYVHQYEDKLYDKKKNYQTVYSMLQIEKCKYLKEYNDKLYKLKQTEALEELNYNTKISNIKINFFSEEKKKLYKIEQTEANKKIISIRFQCDKNKLKSKIDLDTKLFNKNNDLQINKIDFLTQLFYLDLEQIEKETANYYLLLKEICNTSFLIFSIISSTIEIKNAYIIPIRNFFICVKQAFIKYIVSIQKCYEETIREIINARKKITNDLYYSKILDNELVNKNESINKLNKEIIILNNSVEKLEDDNTYQNKKIYSFKYKYSKASNIKTFIENFKLRRNIRLCKRIKFKNNISIRALKKLINKKDKKIEIENNKYNKTINKYKNKLDNNIKSYYILLDDIVEENSISVIKLEQYFNKPFNNKLPNEYYKHLEKTVNNAKNILDNSLKNIYENLNEFKEKREKEIKTKYRHNKYKNNINELKLSISNSKVQNSLIKKYRYIFKNNKHNLINSKKEYQETKLRSNIELTKARNDYNKTTEKLQKLNAQYGLELYNSLHAVIDNITYIENDYHHAMGEIKVEDIKTKSLKEQFSEIEGKLIKAKDLYKNISVKNLKNYKINKKQEIKNITSTNVININEAYLDYQKQLIAYKHQNSAKNQDYKNGIQDCINRNIENNKNLSKSLKAIDNEYKLYIKEETNLNKIELEKIDKTIAKKKYFSD